LHIPCILILENVDTSSATTFSNTKLRLATISYFHRLSGSENPCGHLTFLNLKSAARRRLSAITRDHTLTMERLFAHPSIGTHGVPTSVSDFVFTCILALMFDGCLRWDDISSPTYTDVVWGPDSLRLFRTETPRQIANGVGSGLTSLTTTSCLPASACSYACSNSFDARSQAPVAFHRRYFQLHDIPLSTDPPLPFDPALSLLLLVAEGHQLTVDNFTAFLPSPRSRIRYNAALTCLKSWAPYLGLDPSVLGAQSLLRGSASDHASMGLSDSQFASPSSWKHGQSSTALSSPPLLVTDNSLKSPLAPHFFYNDRGTSLALLLSFF